MANDFMSGVKTSDYHSDMNTENCDRWIEQKLIPNVPSNFVVVIDNAPYHNTQTDHAPRNCDELTVLRLPLYHPDLNSIELIWATVKNNVTERNVDCKIQDIHKIAEEESSRISEEDWQQHCKHVVNIKNKYLESEILAGETRGSLITNVNNESNGDDDNFNFEED
ncbi:hypothetical protein Trydic_g6755 [Trypoxylus dichotomus]